MSGESTGFDLAGEIRRLTRSMLKRKESEMGITEDLREKAREKQGAAEWLRGIIEEYEADYSFASCSKMAKLIVGIDCKSVTCRDCQTLVMTAIADRVEAETDGLRDENEKLRGMVREPQLPEGIEWPRFEDGKLVKVGDTVGSDEPFTAEEIAFESERWLIKASSRSACGYFHGHFGEPVDHPTIKVLDADGVPIEVGDTVYCDDDPEQLIVDSFDDPGCVYRTLAKSPSGMLYTVEPSRLTHECPDSWKRLSDDTEMGAVTYVDKILGVDIDKTTIEEDYEAFARDLVRRAKALAKAGEW